MGICPPGLPFLHKDAAAAVARELIEDSVAESRGLIGLLEIDARDGVVGWCPPASGRRHAGRRRPRGAASATRLPTASRTMFEFLTLHRRAVPSASFVFVLSDFIEPTPLATWEWALDRGWDVVPVVVQDPTWEQGFPDVDRLVLPLADPDGRVRPVRLEKGESQRWRERHEARLDGLVDGLRSLGIEPVLVSEEDRTHVFRRAPRLVDRASGEPGERSMTAKRAALIGFQVILAVLVGLAIRELWLSRSGKDTASRDARDARRLRADHARRAHLRRSGRRDGRGRRRRGRHQPRAPFASRRDFAPYELAGEATVERDVVDGIARVVFRYPLQCLKEGCDPSERRGVAQLDQGFVHYRFVEGSGPGRHILDWPAIEVASRVTPADVERLRWRASETALPGATTRIDPVGLALVLLALAASLAAIAFWLARRLWRTEPEGATEETRAHRSPIERALDLVLADSRNGASSSDRRRALERLARELTTIGQDGLAGDARALAWAPGAASSDDVAGLARRVSEATGAEV